MEERPITSEPDSLADLAAAVYGHQRAAVGESARHYLRQVRVRRGRRAALRLLTKLTPMLDALEPLAIAGADAVGFFDRFARALQEIGRLSQSLCEAGNATLRRRLPETWPAILRPDVYESQLARGPPSRCPCRSLPKLLRAVFRARRQSGTEPDA